MSLNDAVFQLGLAHQRQQDLRAESARAAAANRCGQERSRSAIAPTRGTGVGARFGRGAARLGFATGAAR